MNAIASKDIVEKFADKILTELRPAQVEAAENGTGYFDGLMTMDQPTADCDRVKFTDRHGRLGVVLFSSIGNVVIFQRYKDNDSVFVTNTPRAWKTVIPQGALSKMDLERILNPFDKTNYLERILNDIAKATADAVRFE